MDSLKISIPGAGTRFLLLVAGLFASVAIATTAAMVAADYASTIDAAQQRHTVLAQLVEEHARRAFDIGKASLDDLSVLVMATGKPDAVSATAARMRWWLDDIPQISSFWLLDETGKVVFTTTSVDTAGRNVADREYFKAHAQGEEFHISRMTRGRFDNRWFFSLSKRLVDADGRFRGVLNASMDVDYFAAVYARLDLARTDNMTIFKPDGAVVARRLENWVADGEIGPSLGGHPVVTRHILNASSGAYEAKSTIDHVVRLGAYRKVEGWPLFVAAGSDKKMLIAPWRDRTERSIACCLGVLAALGFVTRWGYGKIGDEEAAQVRNAVLLEEVHHRVKNNLAIIQSLLMLEANRAPAEVRDGYQKSISRIEAMGLVHNLLYQAQDFEGIDAADYIARLCRALQVSAPERIVITADLDPLALAIDAAVPIALILNEVVTNALRHAFAGGQAGTVTVRLRRDGGKGILTVGDDGAGLPAGVGLDRSDGLGLMLVRQLTRQIGGSASLGNDGGTVFTLTFPLPAAPQATG